MTEHQKKCLLSYLGYDVDDLKLATLAFQRDSGLVADGIFGAITRETILRVICRQDWWTEIRHFSRQEFACKCGRCGGFPAEPEEKLVKTADAVRAHFGAAVLVSSGVRCGVHNTAVGGVANSRHLTGKAMDFRVVGKTAAEVLCYVNQCPDIRYAYAIDPNYVHMDVE